MRDIANGRTGHRGGEIGEHHRHTAGDNVLKRRRPRALRIALALP
jgi:hypothetical protein